MLKILGGAKMPDKNTFLQGEYGIPPNAELTFFDGIHEHKDIVVAIFRRRGRRVGVNRDVA